MTDTNETTDPSGQHERRPPGAAERPRARERGRMRRRLREQRRMREALLMDLGALVFELHRHGRREPKLLQAKAAELSAVDAEVRALSEALDHDLAVVEIVAAGIAGSCQGCGMLLSTQASFCASCGAPAKAGLEAAAPASGAALGSPAEPARGGPAKAEPMGVAEDIAVDDTFVEEPEVDGESLDHGELDGDRQPDWEPEAIPESPAEPQLESEPKADLQDEPESELESEPKADLQDEPESELEPYPEAPVETESEAEPEPHSPMAATAPWPHRDVEAEPAQSVEPEPSPSVEPEPTRIVEPEPIPRAQPVRVKRPMGRLERALRGKGKG